MRDLLAQKAEPERILHALRSALSGDGPAILPVQLESPTPGDLPARVARPVAAVIATSGSSGPPKRVALSTDALLASAAATDTAVGGPGRWLLALPVHYIAGLQVLTRSIVAGTDPVILGAGHFDPAAFVAATAELDDARRYTSLVPAQLAALLELAESDPAAATALRSYSAMLIGGQRLEPLLRDRADSLGLRVLRTYGSSETAGGCVYDGRPLATVRVRIEDGEVLVAGPMLAEGYLGDPERTERAFVTSDGLRWYRTGDAGTLEESGAGEVLAVQGRRDDVIISGGEKVSLGLVEAVVRDLPGCGDAVVVAGADPRWGEVPVVVLPNAAAGRGAGTHAGTGSDPGTDPDLSRIRDAVGRALGRAAAPARILRLDVIPTLASGKPDRISLRLMTEWH